MDHVHRKNKANEFEITLKQYLRQGKEKLEKELEGTREAMRIIAKDKTKDFMQAMDKGLSKQERDFLSILILNSMHQSFCYGYGIGKVEGKTSEKVFL